jgi:hypothetical protein
VTPPELVITAPQPGATVTTRTYRFEGSTEPGCTVTAAGRYPADVDAEGNWSIVLVLNEGSNLATFVATDHASTTTTAAITITYQPPGPADGTVLVELRADGLGLVDFGDPVEEAVDMLVRVLGEPSTDQTASGEGEIYGRLVEWSAPRLAVTFNRMDLSKGGEFSETLRLTEWVYTGPGADPGWVLETPGGITIGSALADLQGAYGDDWWLCTLQNGDGGSSFQWMTAAGIPASWQFWPPGSFGLSGWFDRSPEDSDARVEGLSAGWRMADHVCPPPR